MGAGNHVSTSAGDHVSTGAGDHGEHGFVIVHRWSLFGLHSAWSLDGRYSGYRSRRIDGGGRYLTSYSWFGAVILVVHYGSVWIALIIITFIGIVFIAIITI